MGDESEREAARGVAVAAAWSGGVGAAGGGREGVSPGRSRRPEAHTPPGAQASGGSPGAPHSSVALQPC